MTNDAKQPVFIVGTGAAGTALARWLSSHGHPLAGAWNRSSAGANKASALLSIDVQSGVSPKLPDDALVLVAVSDRAIPFVGSLLRPALRPGMTVAHLSGVLPASALGPQAVPRASLHPLVALRSPELSTELLNRGLFTIEGDARAVEQWSAVIRALGADIQPIRAENKPGYHAAAVMAANLVVALVAEASTVADSAGIGATEAALMKLAKGAIENAVARGAAGGLTGPVVRGDAETVRIHLQALDEPTRSLYRMLSRRALSLVHESLPVADRAALESVLSEPDGTSMGA